ncbi:unnamed protein product [Blepharisma stoltei]|uniref:Uncharacterized protein n=1 Tax=Blepharisma stoltei TaxID=1481888 RepID=A0AAU9K7B2_9CILI|nr:unnamed protein product [Blepharisma stoltei]
MQLNTTSSPLSNLYTIQPKKFDGYFQCPRPLSTPYFNDIHGPKTLKPAKPGQLPSNRLPDDITKIPRPVAHLVISSVYDPSTKPPRKAFSSTEPKRKTEPFFHTMSELKASMAKPTERLVRTFYDLTQKMEKEKKNMSAREDPPPKPIRKSFKGYFRFNYQTSNDLWIKDKKVLEASNPIATLKQRQYEELDRKYLEKRRQQRILKNMASGF